MPNRKRKAEKSRHLFRGRSNGIVEGIIATIRSLREYHPLTVRQVYYQLVSQGIIPNDQREYGNISRILVILRRDGQVEWSVIEDRTRRVQPKKGLESLEAHLRAYRKLMFLQYNRCLVQHQDNYVEIWIEKEALSTIFRNASYKYCVRLLATKGHPSATILNDYAVRAEDAIMKGQRPVVLYFGDLDPSGARIPVKVREILETRHRLDVEVVRVALNPDQVERYQLPANPEACKKTDSNFKWYRDQGLAEYAVELDAIHPRDLINLIDASLCEHLDIADMLDEQKKQDDEREILRALELDFINVCHKRGIDL